MKFRQQNRVGSPLKMHTVNLGEILEEIAVLIAYDAVQVAVFEPKLLAHIPDKLVHLAHLAVVDIRVIVVARGRRD